MTGRKKARLLAGLLLVLAAVAFSFWKGGELLYPTFTESEQIDAPFAMTVLKLDSADSILISCNGKFVLIDGGEHSDSKTVTDFLTSQGVEKIELVIATHPHTDHIGGLDEVMKQFEVTRILMPRIPDDMVPTTSIYTKFMETIAEQNIPVTAAVPLKTLTVGEMKFTVLGPVGNDYSDLNNFSAVVRVDFGECSFLLTGDAASAAENDMLDDPELIALLDCDVLKVAHHGGSGSTSAKFAKAVSPEVAVISSRTGEDDGSTYAKVTERLEAVGAKVYATRDDGNVTVTCDGIKVAVTTTQKAE